MQTASTLSYYRKRPDGIANRQTTQTGKDFEGDMISTLKKAFKDSKTFIITDTRGTEYDTKEGTDFMCRERRLDATINFKNKNNMPFIMETDIEAYPGFPFKIGIRHGNNHMGEYHGFEEPVVIIGIDIPPIIYSNYEDDIKKSIEKNAQELMMTAEDCYYSYAEKENLDLQWLRNPNYTPPKNLETKYKESNDYLNEYIPDNDYNLNL